MSRRVVGDRRDILVVVVWYWSGGEGCGDDNLAAESTSVLAIIFRFGLRASTTTSRLQA